MISYTNVEVTYNSGRKFGQYELLKVTKLITERISPDELRIEFLEDTSQAKASVRLPVRLAIPLARELLSVAEGYVSESVSEVA